MRFSLSAALALCVSSALATLPEQADGERPIASMRITLESGDEVPYQMVEGECASFGDPTTPIRSIDIEALKSDEVTCVFYTGDQCDGVPYPLRQGSHTFSREFFVGSFYCF